MSTVKTAISMNDNLYKKMNRFAKNKHVSRSRLISIALEEYLQAQENRKLLNALNDAYSDEGNNDSELLGKMLENHQNLLEDESW